MDTVDDTIIDALGGTTAVARMTETPISTVHSWRKNGIPRSRRAHLALLAERESKVIDWTSGRLMARESDAGDHADTDTTRGAPPSPGIGTPFSPMEAVSG